mgnify:CR=1 FL=1
MMTQKDTTRNIDPEKVTAERLNGYAALFGCIALVGAYATTGQIIPGFVWAEGLLSARLIEVRFICFKKIAHLKFILIGSNYVQ